MNKKWSFYLGRIFGIQVFIHWTFLILIGWIFLLHYREGSGINDGLQGVLFILALFGCVVLHEFGHALTARKFKIQTRNITIYPIGGIASLESMPEKPGQELLVAIAGPLVNVALVIIIWLYLTITNTVITTEAFLTAENLRDLPFLLSLLYANIALATFNMIPAFPMDGGRVLRALLAFKLDRAKATQVAAKVGQFLAIVFVFVGFFFNFWLVFIGLFIYLGAGGEAAFESTKSLLKGFYVRDVLMTKYTLLSPDDALQKAIALLLDGQEQEFLVVNNNGQVEGVLTRNEIIKGLSEQGKDTPLKSVMRKDFEVLTPEMDLHDTFIKIMSQTCTVFPVLQDQQLIGLVDKNNINEWLMVRQASEKN